MLRIVIEADGSSDSAVGGITPVDGPVGDSLIGSVDNVFKAIRDYDQFRCIERMICEAMAEQSDIPGLDGLVSAIAGDDSSSATQTLASTFAGASRPPTSSSSGGSSILDSLDNLIFGGGGFGGFRRRESRPPPRPIRRPPPPRPQRFRGGQIRPRQPPVRRRQPPFPSRRVDNEVEDEFRPSRRIRAKRQTRLQGNIIRYMHDNDTFSSVFIHRSSRLMQATGMDSYNAFPYVRAALIGHATRPTTNRFSGNRVTRRGSACSQLFKDCPTDSNSLLNYFNNHNGGLVNQVQPTVDDEVGPIVQAIIADVVGGGGGTGSTGGFQTAASTAEEEGSFVNSDIFQAGDALFTNAVINGAAELFEGGLDGIVDSIVGKKKK